MILICCADFSGEGETFGEEMYEALPGEEDGVTNGISNGSSSVDNGSDSPVQNKASPSASPRFKFVTLSLLSVIHIVF